MSEAGSPSMSRRGGGGGGGGGLEPVWLGIGSPRPQPRVKQNSMFGHVVDAFDEKTIVKIGEVTPYEKRRRAAEEAAAAKELQLKLQEEADKQAATDRALAELKIDAETVDGPPRSDSVNDQMAETNTDVVRPPPETTLDVNAQSHILISGGRVVNDDQSFEADVYVVDGKIQSVGSNLTVPDGVRVVDARGKLVLPGGIDTITCFEARSTGMTSADDIYTGTKAALSGGTTTIVNRCTPESGQTLIDAHENWRSRCESSSCCDFLLRVAITTWSETVSEEMKTLAKEKGVNCFQFSTSGDSSMDDQSMYKALKSCQQLGAAAYVHAENDNVNKLRAQELIAEGITGPEGHLLSHSEDVEASAVYSAITIANQTNTPICIATVTGKKTADIIARSRRQGKVVFGESLAASLAVDGEHYYDNCWRHAAAYVTSPPLRPGPDTKSCLVNRLANDDLQLVASGHLTFNAAQKALGKDDFRLIPAGLNGVAERMSVVWDAAVVPGKMDPCKFVAITSTNAAKFLNVYPQKGRVAAGSDADLVIWDPTGETTVSAKSHYSQCDFNVFEGLTLKGVPSFVISAGHVVVDSEGLHVAKGSGRYISAQCGSEYLYGRIWAREKLEQPQSVQREDIPVLPVTNGAGSETTVISPAASRPSGEFYSRPPTRSGGRNMQDSSFNISGMSDTTEPDEDLSKPGKKGCGTRINQPPGGRTSTSLW